MRFQLVVRWLLIVAAGYFLFFFAMSSRGLVGPDEPRYAQIAREMARSGDWVTPRLGGEPWFEKPALLYWMGAAAYKAGFEDDRATRVPVALVSLAFLLYFHWQIRKRSGIRAADYAVMILGTSAGWVAFSQVGVFDMLLAASLGAALLALLPWVEKPGPENRGSLAIFGALLGVAMLAKGLVAPVLAALALLPVCFQRGLRTVARDLLHPRVVGPLLIVAGPWYLLCTLHNGPAFLEEFFWRHHFARFLSDSIQHVQPFWFFVPVLLMGLLPWTPLLALYPTSAMRRDPQVRFLLSWALSTLLFFSLSTNKLAGYLLPALPPLAAFLGIRVAGIRRAAVPLSAAGLLLALAPLAEQLLPVALSHGLSKAWPPANVPWLWAIPAVVAAAAAAWLEVSGHRRRAMGVLALATVATFIHLKVNSFPLVDQHAGTRSLWRQIEPRQAEACVGEVRRHVFYGLAYYSDERLPPCSSTPKPYRIEADPPGLTSSSSHRP